MKRTLTINLNGIVFNIDEDAYQILNQYLNDLGRHFAADERDEILKDIEARVAELFTEKLVNRNVVEIKDVQEVMDTLGQPSQFEDESEHSETQTAQPQEDPQQRKRVRKLYRDTANKRIGGVAAGVAAYFDWDPTLVRILFILILIVSFGWTLFIYILMWIFIPEANSVAQRLEMQGVEPNVDNISSHAADTPSTPSSTPSTFAKILKIIAIVILSCMGIGLFASVLGVFIATIMLAFHLLPVAVTVNEIILLTFIGLFLICPAIAIVMFCIYLVNGRKPHRKWIAWTLFALWIASIVGMAITGVNAHYHRDQWKHNLWNCLHSFDTDDDDDTILNFMDEVRDNQSFHAIDVCEAITVKFSQGDSTSVKVNAPDNKIANVRTEIRNGVLYIRNDNENKKGRVIVYVTAPSIDQIKVSEACDFEGQTALDLSKLEIEVDEASTLKLYGKVDTLTVKAEEAANVDLKGITAQVADIRAEEASEVNMGTANDLRIVSNEASTVTYKGNPEKLIKSSSEFSVTRWHE